MLMDNFLLVKIHTLLLTFVFYFNKQYDYQALFNHLKIDGTSVVVILKLSGVRCSSVLIKSIY